MHRIATLVAAAAVVLVFPAFTGTAFLGFGPVPYFLLAVVVLAAVVAWRAIKWVQALVALVLVALFAGNASFIVPELTRPDHYAEYVTTTFLLLGGLVAIGAAIAAFVPKAQRASVRFGSGGAIALLLVAGLALGAIAAASEMKVVPSSAAGGVYATPDATASTTTAKDQWSAPVTVALGKLVKISVANQDTGIHNFHVDALGIANDLAAGKTTDIWVKTDKAGTYQLYCSLHSTKNADGTYSGMVSTFTVA